MTLMANDPDSTEAPMPQSPTWTAAHGELARDLERVVEARVPERRGWSRDPRRLAPKGEAASTAIEATATRKTIRVAR